MSDVLSLLGEKYTRAGSNLECPRCEEKSLWIPKSLKFAQCMRKSSCGFRKDVPEPKQHGWANTLLGCVHHLSTGADFKSSAAFKYLSGSRLIHEDVILAAEIGAVPAVIDWAPIEKAVFDRIEFDAWHFGQQDQIAVIAGSRKADAKASYDEQATRTAATDAIATLKKLLEISAGWVMLFYQSGSEFTAINLRKPEAKEFRNFRPIQGRKGVFHFDPNWLPSGYRGPVERYDPKEIIHTTGHVVTPPPPPPDLIPKEFFDVLGGRILGVEGEINLLQIYSVLHHCNTSIQHPVGRIPRFHGVAFGGSSDPDFEAVQKLQWTLTRDDGKVPDFILCHDDDEPGEAVVEKMQEQMFGYVFYVPDDLDAFLVDQMAAKPQIHERRLHALKSIAVHLKNTYFAYRNLSVLAERIADLRAAKMLNHLREEQVVNEIIEDLVQRGEFYTDGNYGYVFRADTGDLIQWVPGPEVHAFLDELNLAVKQKITDVVIAQIGVKVMTTGEKVKIYQYSHYDQETKCLHINIGNNRMIVLGLQSTTIRENGYNGILFRYPELVPFDEEKLTSFMLGRTKYSDFAETFLDATYALGSGNPDDPKTLILLWMLDFLTGDKHKVRPHLVLQGETGSGKSLLAEKILTLFLGAGHQPEALATDDRDFKSQLTSRPLTCFDNVDEVKSTDRKLDLLAQAADRATVSLRKFYTEAGNLKLPITAHLIFTTMAAKFLRPDVSARSLVINFDRRGTTEADKKTPMEIITEILDHREELFCYLLLKLRQVLKAEVVHADKMPVSPIRLREFYRLALSYATLGGTEAVTRMLTTFTALHNQQRDDATNEDPLYLAIMLLIGSRNHRATFSSTSLLNALTQVIDIYTPNQDEIKRWIPRQLGQKIFSQKNILLEKFGLYARRDPHTKNNIYTFNPTPETKENCIRHCEQINGTLAVMPDRFIEEDDVTDAAILA